MIRKTLFVHFLKSVVPDLFSSVNFIINGGERIESIPVALVTDGPDYNPVLDDKIIVLSLPEYGDFSTYTLQIVQDKNSNPLQLLDGYDLMLSKIDFSFKVLCPDDFDCQEDIECYTQESISPSFINYLAKDYSSFKQVIVDRFAQILPEWADKNPAGLGMTLIETLAYVADYLSYRQDAISTEAYLGSARKRISVARHARLADYKISNGCNARTWVHLALENTNASVDLKKDEGIKFLTKIDGSSSVIPLNTDVYWDALLAKPTVFELMHDVTINPEHNEMQFYTFGESSCCLPKGSTSAYLKGDKTSLNPNDFLILKEKKGADSGLEQDADRLKRQVVRLLKVEKILEYDFEDYHTFPKVEITKITWHEEDALPFSLCVSSSHNNKNINNVSVALGNIALCDHGMTREDADFEKSSIFPSKVPTSIGHFTNTGNSMCDENESDSVPVRYAPVIMESPITIFEDILEQNIESIDERKIMKNYSATRCMNQNVTKALPSLTLIQRDDSIEKQWHPKSDLLTDSIGEVRHFVGELESDGVMHIRFGDEINGERPNENTQFKARYRLGSGPAGNIGSDTISHIVLPKVTVGAMGNGKIKTTNPLPGIGGKRPESIEEIKQFAPVAFRGKQERAIISDDYAFIAKRENTKVQKASAQFRWTGSWNTAFVALDLMADTVDKNQNKINLRNKLNNYRLAGMDLVIDDPKYVSMEIKMTVCISPYSYRSDVYKDLKRKFSSQKISHGALGFFHPDNFSFGDTLYLSNIYKVAQNVPGVTSVRITKFCKQNDQQSSQDNINLGKIEFDKREIPRLDNNPSFRDKGIIEFTIRGGK